MPRASTDRSGERTSESTTSMSWIIRSKHHADVHRAERKAGRPHGLDEFWISRVGSCRRQRRIESLDVSDLEHELPSPGQFDQFIGLGHGRADGLLDEQVRSRFQKIDGQTMVQHGRRGDHRRIDAAQQGGDGRSSEAVCSSAASRSRLAASGSTTPTSSTLAMPASFWAWKPPKRPAPMTAMRSGMGE